MKSGFLYEAYTQINIALNLVDKHMSHCSSSMALLDNNVKIEFGPKG